MDQQLPILFDKLHGHQTLDQQIINRSPTLVSWTILEPLIAVGTGYNYSLVQSMRLNERM